MLKSFKPALSHQKIYKRIINIKIFKIMLRKFMKIMLIFIILILNTSIDSET